ncbi:MAG TPA: hypothetical protein VKV21_01515 [Solirubrobacteraceae bacterium]|nr:hypothetical protein [Solirubrobacteraceae bacterium]
MNTPTDTTPTETDIRPGEVRTYRGRTLEELIPQIRAELGPGAMILRERQGLTGGVGGFFAKRCVEIDAQAAPGLSVYADDDDEALLDELLGAPATGVQPMGAQPTAARPAGAQPGLPQPAVPQPAGPQPAGAQPAVPQPARPQPARPQPAGPQPAGAQPTPDPFAGFAARLEAAAAAAAAAPLTPEPFTPTPPEAFVPEVPAPAPTEPELSAPAPTPARPATAPAPAGGFIAFDELTADREPEPEAESAAQLIPTAVFNTEPIEPEPAEREPVALSIPILLDVAPAASGAGPVFRPRPLTAETNGQRATFRPLADPTATLNDEAAGAPAGESFVRGRLIAHGLSASLGARLVTAAREAADSDEEPLITVAAQAALAAMLPPAAPLPLDGGVVAVVGPTGSGKTRAVAALAIACARAGHDVTVARVAGAGPEEELAELLAGEKHVELVPAMKTKATARAVAAARDEDLVILDTPATTPGEASNCEALAATLGRFAPDHVLLCAPATFTLPALTHLVEHHAVLRVNGLLATHADIAGMLGTVAELSIETRIPLGHVHSGLNTAGAISSIDSGALAADLVR